jgi:hypothetical protein
MKTNDPLLELAVNVIDRHVESMVRLVARLLDISRITVGQFRLASEQIDLRVGIGHQGVQPLIERMAVGTRQVLKVVFRDACRRIAASRAAVSLAASPSCSILILSNTEEPATPAVALPS